VPTSSQNFAIEGKKKCEDRFPFKTDRHCLDCSIKKRENKFEVLIKKLFSHFNEFSITNAERWSNEKN
jgi:hypothetical protein